MSALLAVWCHWRWRRAQARADREQARSDRWERRYNAALARVIGSGGVIGVTAHATRPMSRDGPPSAGPPSKASS